MLVSHTVDENERAARIDRLGACRHVLFAVLTLICSSSTNSRRFQLRPHEERPARYARRPSARVDSATAEGLCAAHAVGRGGGSSGNCSVLSMRILGDSWIRLGEMGLALATLRCCFKSNARREPATLGAVSTGYLERQKRSPKDWRPSLAVVELFRDSQRAESGAGTRSLQRWRLEQSCL